MLTWIRENGRLNYVDDNIERVLGWTAGEIKAMPFIKVMTEASYDDLKKTYLKGPPGDVAHRALALDMRHKDGRIIEMCLSVVCRYDDQGRLAEAYGSVHRCVPHQHELDDLLTWCQQAKAEALDAFIHAGEMLQNAIA